MWSTLNRAGITFGAIGLVEPPSPQHASIGSIHARQKLPTATTQRAYVGSRDGRHFFTGPAVGSPR